MYCTNCGTKLPDDSGACTNCGSVFESNKPAENIEGEISPINNEVNTGAGSTEKEQYDEINAHEQQTNHTYTGSDNRGYQQKYPHQDVINTETETKTKKSIFKLISLNERGFGYLIMALFTLNISFLFKSILLKLTLKPLPIIWTPVFSVVSWLGMLMFLLLYLKHTKSVGITADNIKKVIPNSVLSVLLMVSFISVFGLVTGNLYSLVVKTGLDNPQGGILLAAGYTVLLFILQFLLMSGVFYLYFSARYTLSVFSCGKTYLRILALMFKKLPLMTLINIFATLILAAAFMAQGYIGSFIDSVQPYGFLTNFMKHIVSAVILAYIFQILCNTAEKTGDENGSTFESIKTTKGKALPVMLVILIIPIIVSFITFYSVPSNPFKRVVSEINSHTAKGDIMAGLGYTAGATQEYDMAVSRLYALNGYLKIAKSIKIKDNQFKNEGNEDLKKAAQFDIYNGYVQLFKGNVYLSLEDYGNALNSFKTGIKNEMFLPETFLGLLEANSMTGNKKGIDESLDWLMRNEVFHDTYGKIMDSSINRLNDYLAQIEKLTAEIEPKLVYKYYEKTKYNNHVEALSGLTALKTKYPDNAEIRYLLSLIYAEYRNEQSNYAILIEETEAFDRLYNETMDADTQLGKEVYKAQMHMMADDFQTAETIYADLYKQYPDSIETAETYLYVLLRNKKHEEALSIIETLKVKNVYSLQMLYQHAVCLLNLDRHEDSLGVISEITAYGDEYSEEFDRYLYAYSLAYVNAIKNEQHINAVELVLKDHILYSYISGLKGWRDKDSELSNSHLLKVIEQDNRLGYAMYAIGINYYEQAVRSGSNDFEKAIEYYLKSLEVLPEHVEGYFSMAHCYKKAGMKKEALRAFRKVLDLVPYEDHRVDPYGMVVHAQGEVDTLVSELEKEGF